jgi:hypothetical protein
VADGAGAGAAGAAGAAGDAEGWSAAEPGRTEADVVAPADGAPGALCTAAAATAMPAPATTTAPIAQMVVDLRLMIPCSAASPERRGYLTR